MRLVAAALALVLSLGACSTHSDQTGSYIGGDDSARMMVQILSVKGHEVEGELTAVMTNRAGGVTAFSKHVSGTIDAKLVNLNIENGAALSLITGTLDGEKLDLTFFSGKASQKVALVRSDPAKFAELTDAVRRRAAAIKQAALEQSSSAAQVERVSGDQRQIMEFTQSMIAKADGVSENASKIDAIAASYQNVLRRAGRISDAKNRLSARPGDSGGQLDQLAFAKDQNADTARANHDLVVGEQQSFNDAARRYADRAAALTALCASTPELDCGGMEAAMTVYRSRSTLIQAAIAREGRAYEALRSKL